MLQIPLWVALTLGLATAAGLGELAGESNKAPTGPTSIATAPRVSVLGEPFVFQRKGRRDPFERPNYAPPEPGKRLTYHQQLQLVRQAAGVLDEIRAAYERGERGMVLARYDVLLEYSKYRFTIEEVSNQLQRIVQSAQSIVAEAAIVRAEELLTQIATLSAAGQTDQALGCYRQMVDLTNPDRFTDAALRQQMAALRSRANEAAPGLSLVWGRTQVQAMTEWMDRGEFVRVISGAQDLAAIFQEQEFPTAEKQAQARSLLLAAVRLSREAELQIRFNDEGIVVSGVVYTSFLPSAIVNGRVVYEGDEINGIRVARIEPDRVVFIYRGQTVGRSLAIAGVRSAESRDSSTIARTAWSDEQ